MAHSTFSIFNVARTTLGSGNHRPGRVVEPLREPMELMPPAPDHRTPPWMLRALCRDAAPGEFFPSDGVGVEQACRTCAACPVRLDCLEYALAYRIDHGVWGGCSERERRRILRRRRLAPTR